MRLLTITFPCMPASELMPNAARRIHWAVKSKIAGKAREQAKILGLANKGQWQAPERAKITYEFHVANRRRRDLDGLISACKPYIDGLVDAGILKDDSGFYLSIGGASMLPAKENETRVIIQEILSETTD